MDSRVFYAQGIRRKECRSETRRTPWVKSGKSDGPTYAAP